MRDPSHGHHDVEVAITDDLVGDINIPEEANRVSGVLAISAPFINVGKVAVVWATCRASKSFLVCPSS
jgi:hypothetical protein